MKLFATALLLATVTLAQDPYGEEVYGEEYGADVAPMEEEPMMEEEKSSGGLDLSNKCLANFSAGTKHTVNFVFDLLDLFDACDVNGNSCFSALFGLLALGGKANSYAGKSVKSCLGWTELGGCLNVAGKASTRIMYATQAVFDNWVYCNVDTYNAVGC